MIIRLAVLPYLDFTKFSKPDEVPDKVDIEEIEIEVPNTDTIINIIHMLRDLYVYKFFDPPRNILVPFDVYLGLREYARSNPYSRNPFPIVAGITQLEIMGMTILPNDEDVIRIVPNSEHVCRILFEKRRMDNEKK